MTAEDHPDLRASDLERDRTIDILRDAAGEGRLTFEELADRIEDAARARTRGELALLTRDLPAGRAAATPAPGPGPADAPGAAPAPAASQSSVFGDVRRKGAWIVPPRSSWHSVFGDVVLDLREAQVNSAEVHIDAVSVFGDVDLLVPEGIAVEVRVTAGVGSVRQKAGDAAPPGAPRVILTGWTAFGDVHVRAHRLRERIADRLLGRAQRG
jgi:hypothetical protein